MMKRLREEESRPFGGRVFSCKTCNREFSSFQALGGHRASHRKPKIGDSVQNSAKPRTHQCSICGLDFPVGQALGGHMRRHRNHSPAHEIPAPAIHVEESLVGLDLNLTPLENDLVRLHLMAPPVGCRT